LAEADLAPRPYAEDMKIRDAARAGHNFIPGNNRLRGGPLRANRLVSSPEPKSGLLGTVIGSVNQSIQVNKNV
jgi:hypothetical protein